MADDVFYAHLEHNRTVAKNNKGRYESQIEIKTVEVNVGQEDWEGYHNQADLFPGWDNFAWKYATDNFNFEEEAQAFNDLFLKEGRQKAMDWYGHKKLLLLSLEEALELSPHKEAYASSPDEKKSIAILIMADGTANITVQEEWYANHKYIRKDHWSARFEILRQLAHKENDYRKQRFLNMLSQVVWLPIGTKEAE